MLKQKYILRKTIRKQYTIRENCYYLTEETHGWKRVRGSIWSSNGSLWSKLVGTFLLEKISEICNEGDIGLYRDDGLAIFRNKSGTQLEKIKKKLQRLFKE